MRSFVASIIVLLGFGSPAFAQTPTTCTSGLCTQQVSCPSGGTTSVTGVVYAPNGLDPLPNVTVFVPNVTPDPFVPGVSCPVVGAPPSGSPLVGAVTAVDGTFTIPDMPVGTNIPLVIQSGRWRRQVTIPTVSACASTSFSTRFPQTQLEGDIPKFAIVTGSADQVECVLSKVGISPTEFTDPTAGGRVNLYSGSGSPGALVDSATPNENTLMQNLAALNAYDVLMLPCQGGAYTKTAAALANLIAYTSAGGRVYSSHFSYVWMYQNPPFDSVANWTGSSTTLPDGIGVVDNTFSDGNILSKWLTLVGASTVPGQIAISTVKHDFNGVNKTVNQSWMTLNDLAANDPVMQFVFDTPVGATGKQCGKVLFNEYHVENPTNSPTGRAYPAECNLSAPMTPQEKLLEYSLFELTNDGAAATLTPATQDFGTQAVGFNSPTQTFTWTNNSTFAATVTLLSTAGDFTVTSSNCAAVPAGASCSINVVFNPTAIGPRTGTLTVGSSSSTLISSLTGTGIPDLSLSFSALDFGSADIGAHVTKSLTVTNSASGAVPVPPFVTTGDFSVTSNCGSTLAALASCQIAVTFTPTVSGARTGTLAVQTAAAGTPTTLTGNGLDFTLVNSPTSGTVIAGYGTSLTTAFAPLAGFNAEITLTCTTNAPGSVCSPAAPQFSGGVPTTVKLSITTTAKYAVVGYSGGFGEFGVLWAMAAGSGMLLWLRRRKLGLFARASLIALLLAIAALSTTGCTGKTPAINANYTPAGAYTYTVTATDGFLAHSATYSLNVTVN